MDEEQALEEAELRDAVVGHAGSLKAFAAGDADANVLGWRLVDAVTRLEERGGAYRGLYHGDVVGAVADS